MRKIIKCFWGLNGIAGKREEHNDDDNGGLR